MRRKAFTTLQQAVLIVALLLLVSVEALPVTPEDKEITLLTNFTLGWTRSASNGTYRFTLRLDSRVQTWIGVGVSQGTGIGSQMMITGAAAVVAKSGLLNVGFEANEYALTAKTEAGIVPWATTGPSQLEITRCVQRTCPDDATRCQSNQACLDALQCASQGFGANGSSALAQCTQPLGNGTTTDSINAIGAFLDTTGCYFSNCADSLQKNAARSSNLISGSVLATQVAGGQGFISTLTFSASKIGDIDLNRVDQGVTIIAAYGTDSKFGYHGPANHRAVTLNLATGEASKTRSPDWVIGHVAFMTAGLGILAPLGVIVKTTRVFQGHAIIQLVAVFLSLVGVGWAAFYVENIGSEIHHVLGIITMVLVVVQPLTYFFRPSESSVFSTVSSSQQQQQQQQQMVVSSGGDQGKQKLLVDAEAAVDERRQTLKVWGQVHGLLGFTTLLMSVVTAFLGADKLRASEIDSSSLAPLSIVFLCFSCLALVFSVLMRVKRRLMPSATMATMGSGMVNNNHKDASLITSSSTAMMDNPKFKAASTPSAATASEELLGHAEDDDLIKVTPCFLAFHDVSYRAALTRAEKKKGETQGKLILSGCSGFCAPGSLTAIMGPVSLYSFVFSL